MQPNGAIGTGLTDDEVGLLHEILTEVVVYDAVTMNEEDKLIADTIYSKVNNEAKVRKFWWAR